MTPVFAVERHHSVLRASIDEALSLARQLGGPALLSQIARLPYSSDPIAFLAASSQELGGGILWHQPESGVTFSGAGSAFEIRASGPGRFSKVSAAMRDMRGRLIRSDDAPFPCIGGFAFSESAERSVSWRDFPDAKMVIPSVLLQIDEREALLRITIHVDPDSPPCGIESDVRDLLQRAERWATASLPVLSNHTVVRRLPVPGRTVWESSVAAAVSMIRQGMIDKVVLAREERLLADRPLSPVSTLKRLRLVDSSATLIAMQSGGSWFVGATPERMVRLQDGRVDVTCLAGSIGIGTNESEKRQFATRLLASEKDREEHEIVVRSTMSALEEVCENVTRFPGTPRVVSARSVQHLETPLFGELAGAGNVLELVESLHPTPAVGGYPRDRALSIIRELEEIDRGWYAGPFGWMDLDGSGEFAVAIRSAVLSGATASLFAGCGVVAGSLPADEYEETCLKLRPMLSALSST